MALVKGIENIYGAEFKYHKISDVRIMVTKNGVMLKIITDSYVDKKARMEGKTPVRTENIIQNADFALTAFYQLLKIKFGDFSDANDDFEDDWKVTTQQPQVMTQQTPQGQLISRYTETDETTDQTESEEE